MTEQQAEALDRASLDQIFSYIVDRLSSGGKDEHKSVNDRPRFLATYCETLIAVPVESVAEGGLSPQQLRYVLAKALLSVQLYLLGRRANSADRFLALLSERQKQREELSA